MYFEPPVLLKWETKKDMDMKLFDRIRLTCTLLLAGGAIVLGAVLDNEIYLGWVHEKKQTELA
jgi:hypothetical protein